MRAAWRRAIDATKRSGHVPAEHHIWHRGRDSGDLVIELRQGSHPDMARRRSRPDAIAVPDDVADWHPAAAAEFRNISAGSIRRAQLIAHALATAASLQGLEVGAAEGLYALTFRSAGQLCGLRFYEEYETRDVLPDPDAQGSDRRYSWQRVQAEAREVPSGRLVMEFDEDWHLRGRRRRFADRQLWKLDAKLRDVLAEIVFRLKDQRERREAAERAERDKQQAWRAAMAQARLDFHDSRRIEALDRQLSGWEKAKRIRSYCDALAAVRDEHDDERTAWVAWARAYADRLDPRGRSDLAPAEVEPTPHQLAPFLKGWSLRSQAPLAPLITLRPDDVDRDAQLALDAVGIADCATASQGSHRLRDQLAEPPDLGPERHELVVAVTVLLAAPLADDRARLGELGIDLGADLG
ncbi:hypothetical protein [Pseudonocardia adelaidensis]|uniref:Uncharacterized protein n=1 Tax=Pseudonocardia adelaidensis TaxID=648754 RepID=A0ABP9P4D4_9PSEU